MHLKGRTLLLFVLSLISFGAFAQTDSNSHKQDSSGNNIGHFSQTQMTTPVDSPTSNAQQGTQTTQVTAPKGQNIGSVTGVLINSQKKPVSYATITLMRSDSTVVNGDLSKDDGSFSISPTGVGNFTLRIQAIGLKVINMPVSISPKSPDKDLGNITVVTSQNTLKEVDIVAEKPMMEMNVDKKVFNVEKNITTAGGSATDVLSNVPSVSVDVDGNVSLRNNANVTILIDGKPATLLGSDQASALQSLPAASIESVEVITNPSAKYDAQGNTGIINIVTKKSNALGFNGTATLGAGTNDKYNGSLGLNLRKNKWNVFLNSSFRLNDNYNNTTTDIYGKGAAVGDTTSSHSYEHQQRHFDGSFNSIGASYDINKRKSITLTENINIMDFGSTDNSIYNIYGNTNETDLLSTERRTATNSGGPISSSTALDYKGKFKKVGEEIDVDGTYTISTIHRTQDYTTYLDGFNPASTIGPITETAPASGTNTTFNGSVDYTDPLFTKNGKLGLGAKTQIYSFNSNNTPLVDTNGGPQYTDPTLLTKFNYTQQIDAGYINWNDQYGKFSYQAGLRGEYNEYNGVDYALSNANYTQNVFNLFPSAFASYQLPNQQSIYLNYSRRTNRPNFFQLLPYKDVSNPSIVSEGNPDLRPEYIQNIEFSYTKQDSRGDNFIVSAYYTYTQNLIEKIMRPVLASDSLPATFANSQFTQPQNLASGTTYGLELIGHIQILPIWDATLNFNFFQNEINIGNVDSSEAQYLSDNSGFSWFGKLNTNLRLPAGFSLQINANYESPKPIAQGTLKQVYWVDAAVRKNLWKNKATVVVNCSDIFNTRKYTTLYNLAQYDETYYRDRETRVGTITFTYRFGKAPKASTPRKSKNSNAVPGEEERENNLKQGEDNDQGGGMGGGGNGGGGGNSGGGNGGGGGSMGGGGANHS
jgi:iron complex outermembrane recepter protein